MRAVYRAIKKVAPTEAIVRFLREAYPATEMCLGASAMAAERVGHDVSAGLARRRTRRPG